MEVLLDGGNAVDATVTAGMTLCVVLPNACGLGGDALMLVGRRDGPSVAINGNGAAPADVQQSIPADGGGTAAVPGAVAALFVAHERFGRLPRERVLAPAIRMAREGFPVGVELLGALDRQRERLERGSAGWSLLDQASSGKGIVCLPRLADLLEQLARDGPLAFYSGPVAEAVAAAARAQEGTMQAADLEAYSALVGEPAAAEFRDATIEVTPPTSQGILLLIALRRLEDLIGAANGPPPLPLQTRAIRECFAFRDEVACDDAVQRLLGVSLPGDIGVEGTAGGPGPRGYNHTAAAAVCDDEGIVVSALLSVFDDFGSATLVPEYEFILNSRLLGFDADGRNRPAPSRRPVHTLAPTLVRTRDRLLGMATPGADGQIQTLLQVLLSSVGEGMPLQTALHRPRWRLVDGIVCLEAGFDKQLAVELEEHGQRIDERPAGDELFGAVSAVSVAHDGSPMEAASDPRRESWAGCL
jgi:gamma-glutamyltranspeptidase/glutathione hydrolase